MIYFRWNRFIVITTVVSVDRNKRLNFVLSFKYSMFVIDTKNRYNIKRIKIIFIVVCKRLFNWIYDISYTHTYLCNYLAFPFEGFRLQVIFSKTLACYFWSLNTHVTTFDFLNWCLCLLCTKKNSSKLLARIEETIDSCIHMTHQYLWHGNK